MTLPPNFLFSQQKLQDYLTCPKRFELLYIQKLVWPAVQSEPVLELEHQMELGERFHRMIQQHQCGVPVDCITRQASDPSLLDWWDSYMALAPDPLPVRRYPEFTLTTNFCGFRVIAKYDLLAIEPGNKALIIDWKTSRQKPRRDRLEERMQTRLYPLLLMEAGSYLNGNQPLEADQIEMIYWFSCDPNHPERFPYSEARYFQDRSELSSLIEQISHLDGNADPTNDEKNCQYCVYRSYCSRGKEAGEWDFSEDYEPEEGSSLDIRFEQIGEIMLG